MRHLAPTHSETGRNSEKSALQRFCTVGGGARSLLRMSTETLKTQLYSDFVWYEEERDVFRECLFWGSRRKPSGTYMVSELWCIEFVFPILRYRICEFLRSVLRMSWKIIVNTRTLMYRVRIFFYIQGVRIFKVYFEDGVENHCEHTRYIWCQNLRVVLKF